MGLKSFISDLNHRYVYERPSGAFRKHLEESLPENLRQKFKSDAKQLSEFGAVCLPEYFAKELDQLKSEFSVWMQNHAISSGETDDEDGKANIGHYAISNEGFAGSVAIAKAAADSYLTRLAAHYWGKPIYLSQVGGTRLDPCDVGRDYRAMQWHHDTKHKQVKIFILLTDLEEHQQCTKYIAGSHKIWHPSSDHGRRTREFMEQFGKPVSVVGKAGTVWVFDTNGYHRGTRNNTVRRDIVVFNFTAGKSLFPLKVSKAYVNDTCYDWFKNENLKIV